MRSLGPGSVLRRLRSFRLCRRLLRYTRRALPFTIPLRLPRLLVLLLQRRRRQLQILRRPPLREPPNCHTPQCQQHQYQKSHLYTDYFNLNCKRCWQCAIAYTHLKDYIGFTFIEWWIENFAQDRHKQITIRVFVRMTLTLSKLEKQIEKYQDHRERQVF